MQLRLPFPSPVFFPASAFKSLYRFVRSRRPNRWRSSFLAPSASSLSRFFRLSRLTPYALRLTPSFATDH